MKLLKTVLSLLLCTLLLTGCEKPDYNGDVRLVVCIRYDAPAYHLMGGSMKKIETDRYGRVLFKYSLKSSNTGFLGICQGYTKDTSSFYQDYSVIKHINGENGGTDFSEVEIAQLKKNNDWDSPLMLSSCKDRTREGHWGSYS